MPPKNTRRMLLMLINTVFFLAFYYLIPRLGSVFLYFPILYLVGGAVLGLWYVIYNRGFNTRGKTPEMLPDSIPYAEREFLVAEGKRRMEKSRWALYILLPIIFTLILDIALLFLFSSGSAS